jgi:hypothetical protein
MSFGNSRYLGVKVRSRLGFSRHYAMRRSSTAGTDFRHAPHADSQARILVGIHQRFRNQPESLLPIPDAREP